MADAQPYPQEEPDDPRLPELTDPHRRPAAVGALLAWLASQAGIALDTDSSTALTAGVVALAMAGYYTLIRVTEAR